MSASLRSLPAGAILLAAALSLSCVAPAAGQPAERPFREAFVVETDGTAEKKLAAVGEYVAQQRWDAAVSLLREVAAARPDAVVRVSPSRSLSLPRYCDVLLTRLPSDGLAAYRRGIDPQAAAWLAEADATGDERLLRAVAERAFASSSGDEAVFRLAERAWERGEFDLARRYWTLLVPIGVAEGEEPPAVLRYPDTDLNLAVVRSRLVLCGIALGEYDRAERELAAFRVLHPEATGRFAGREGRLADLLADTLAAARGSSEGEGRDGWDVLPPVAATQTFAATADRAGFVTDEPPSVTPVWFRPLPRSGYVTDLGRPVPADAGPLCYYPVVWKDKTFVADADRVFGFELETGRAAWAVADDDPGVLYPPAADLVDLRSTLAPAPAGPFIGVPRHTLTIEGDRLYARLGPPVTAWPTRELRRIESTIVCLDLAREGLLAWSLSSETLGGAEESWAFEGPPAADGDRLYLLASRSRPQAQLNALCLDAATGAVLWNRPVGAPIASPPDGAAVMTHRLVTVAAGRLYVQTNHGAVVCLDADDGEPVWVGWYESRPPAEGAAANAPDRNLPAACLAAGGVVVAAPADSDRLFAYDAASGVELWSRSIRGGGRELLGARDGVLVVSGERLHGLDLFGGRELWSVGFENPPGYGAGRGLLAGRFAYWPTRQDLFVVDIETGAPFRRVRLKNLYGFAGGGNLAASAGRLLLARPDGILALGDR